MTNEEKYKLLDAVIEATRDNVMGGKYAKAFRNGVVCAYNRLVEAINKLVQQPSEDCISREQALLALTGMDLPTDRDKLIALFTERIQHLPPVTPTNADTREAYIKGYDYGVKDWFKSKAQPSEDCVSRQDAIDTVVFECGEWIGLAKEISKQLRQLPPVTPQRPKGKWMYKMQVMNNPYTYKCSVCNGWEKDKTKYCPNCGSYNGGNDNGDE